MSTTDKTKSLKEFEKISFREMQEVVMSLSYIFTTPDDDVFGTRAADNQVKYLFTRKKDREGLEWGALADASYRIVLGVRFRSRFERQ